MASRSRRSAILACLLLALTTVVAGCSSGREGGAGREGKPESVGGLDYNVFITRELNLRDPEDHGYYQGPEAPPGFAYFGVFINVCNNHHQGPLRPASTNMYIVDTLGDKFRPVKLPSTNIFAYRPRKLANRACLPVPGSIPALTATGGNLVLFKIPLASIENRPLDLIVKSQPDGATGKVETGKIELDI